MPTIGRLSEDGLSPAETVMLRSADAEAPTASWTVTVNAKRPDAVGMPPMTPDAALRPRPGGSAPELTDQV